MRTKLVGMCLAVMFLCGSAMAVPELPVFDPANFTPGTPIDNTYFPLTPGKIFTYGAEIEEDGEMIEVLIKEHVTLNTKNIAGVTAVVVRVREWIDGLLVEDTRDWYAQDDAGNVWYMGEFSTEFEYDEDDNPIGMNHDGSWKTGVNGALPGYIMKAAPAVGDGYYQEYAPLDGALDQAEITSLTAFVSIDFGDFNNVLVALESTELEPGMYGNKLYAPGVGLVLIEEGVDEFGNDPTATIPLISCEIPEPATCGLLAGGMIYLMRRGAGRTRRVAERRLA